MSKNWGCDNDKCTDANSEIRVLPTGGSSNALLCKACYQQEIYFRKFRNLELDKANQFKIPNWLDLKVYDPGT